MTIAVCPKCSVEFEAASNRAYFGMKNLSRRGFVPFAQVVRENSKVKCPHCRFEFESDAVRFFGVLNPRGMRRLLVILRTIFVMFFLAVALIGMLNSPWWNR